MKRAFGILLLAVFFCASCGKDMLTHSIFRIFCYTSVALIWERRWKEGKSG